MSDLQTAGNSGKQNIKRDAPVTCAACGRRAARKSRQQKFCSDRCRQFAARENKARTAIKNPVGYQDTGQPTNPPFLPNKNKELIEKIAQDPVGTFELWRDADKPFSFVAARRELTRAWADPADFVTHLPIGFDGTCSGIQHLAMLARDEVAGKLVNLTNAEEPHDIYGVVIAQVKSALEMDDNEFAHWWRDHLRDRDEKQIRKLLKAPIMTFAYSVTPIGMADQIAEDYEELFRPNRPVERKAAYYLALKIVEACKGALPGPAKVMEYIRDLAEQCTQQGRMAQSNRVSG